MAIQSFRLVFNCSGMWDAGGWGKESWTCRVENVYFAIILGTMSRGQTPTFDVMHICRMANDGYVLTCICRMNTWEFRLKEKKFAESLAWHNHVTNHYRVQLGPAVAYFFKCFSTILIPGHWWACCGYLVWGQYVWQTEQGWICPAMYASSGT